MDRIRKAAPELAQMIEECDFLDVVESEGEVTLREFIAGMAAWHPLWLKFLYLLRSAVAPLFSIHKIGIPPKSTLEPSKIPFEKGSKFMFGKVFMGFEDRMWAVESDDHHLMVVLAVVREPLNNGRARFSVVTMVNYFMASGRAYISLIKPFHDRIVRKMIEAGIAGFQPHGEIEQM